MNLNLLTYYYISIIIMRLKKIYRKGVLFFMANSFINFFKEPPAIGTIKNKAEITQKYSHYRKVLMFALYIGYVVSYIGRKNLSIAMPIISSTFGMNKFQLGLLSSTFYVK